MEHPWAEQLPCHSRGVNSCTSRWTVQGSAATGTFFGLQHVRMTGSAYWHIRGKYAHLDIFGRRSCHVIQGSDWVKYRPFESLNNLVPRKSWSSVWCIYKYYASSWILLVICLCGLHMLNTHHSLSMYAQRANVIFCRIFSCVKHSLQSAGRRDGRLKRLSVEDL